MCELVEYFCMRMDLSTYDPYDIWKTTYGLRVKKLFNRNRLLGLVPASLLSISDAYVNNYLRVTYTKQEYPIVRALAALSLLNLYQIENKPDYLKYVIGHLEWLASHPSTNCVGCGWGLGFEHAASASVVYSAETPFSTITPYPLEAFIAYRKVTGDTRFDDIIRGVFTFIERDLQVMEDNDLYLVTSYGTTRDRVVVNAVSYTMYAYTLLRPYFDSNRQKTIDEKVSRLYAFIRDQQRTDGSFLYSPEGRPFIDCFHSCIVLKNIIKTDRLVGLKGASQVIDRGYQYLKENFADPRSGLFRRFSLQNKPSLVKFDLYDNAEMLNLGILMHDRELVTSLSQEIERVFRRDKNVYSQVDRFNRRFNKNMLRWAVMPYLYALSAQREAMREGNDTKN